MKILCAVDGSDASLHAARKALELSKDVTLCTVVAPLFIPVEVAFDPSKFQEEAVKAAEALVTDAARELGNPSLSRVCLQGSIAECIDAHAVANRFDLIAVGSKGRGAVSRVLLGSTTDRLVHISHLPVLVVR
jgi:nucleotide-binding universal stress UspA family protein